MNLKIKISFLLILFGLLLAPTYTLACNGNSIKTCCSKILKTNSEKKSCCGKEKSNRNNDCNGKCGHANCTSISPNLVCIISQFEIELQNNYFNFNIKKQNFINQKTFISKGFLSIWIPPVIS